MKIGTMFVAFVCAGSSCTVIYDSDVFVGGDAAVIIEPTELALETVEPASIFEGQGASGTARAIPIIVRGRNIAPGARLTIVGAGMNIDVEAQTSADGTMAATEIRVPVDTELAAGASLPVVVTLSQVGVEQQLSFDVQGLDELDELSGVVDTASLAPRYSRIEITDPVEFVGSNVARLVATDTITVAGTLRADGRGDGQRSAGGFLGGQPTQDGGGAGGGAKSECGSGGGGGGNLEMGGPGQGTDSGIGGAAIEAPFLFPLETVVGYGGGGGESSNAGNASGGSGGGAIELRAGGLLTLTAGAILAAEGRSGGQGSCLLGPTCGGGGGSGGALLLRSATAIDIAGDVAISVAGGSGGAPAGDCTGGNGAPGRVRIDAPQIDGSLPATVTGPSFLPGSAPAVVATKAISVDITGGVGSTYFLTVNARTAETITLDDVTKTISLALSPGLNQVCALVDPDGNQGQPESLNCVSIAYLP